MVGQGRKLRKGTAEDGDKEGCDSLPRRRDPCRVYMGRPHRDLEDEKAARTKPDIVAISGTSAGALCALATWYGLVANTADPECGTIDKAVERLDFLWTTFAATTPVELVHNQMVGSLLHWKSKGAPFSGSNPYDVSGNLGLAGLSMMGARREYLEFPALLRSLCPHFETVDWPRVAKADLRIPRRGHRGSQRQLRGLRFRQEASRTGGCSPTDPRSISTMPPAGACAARSRSEGVAASGTLPEICRPKRSPTRFFRHASRARW